MNESFGFDRERANRAVLRDMAIVEIHGDLDLQKLDASHHRGFATLFLRQGFLHFFIQKHRRQTSNFQKWALLHGPSRDISKSLEFNF